MSRFTNSITAFRITQPADTSIWSAIIFTRDNTALGRLTVRRTIAFVGGDFRVLLRFNVTSPFFTSVVHNVKRYFVLASARCSVFSGVGAFTFVKETFCGTVQLLTIPSL